MVFLYTIRNPCGIVFYTKDPEYAKQASNNGCIVTCKRIKGNVIGFKASTNVNKNKPETIKEYEGCIG